MSPKEAWDKLREELKNKPITSVRVVAYLPHDAPVAMTDPCSGIYPIREIKKERK